MRFWIRHSGRKQISLRPHEDREENVIERLHEFEREFVAWGYAETEEEVAIAA